MRDRRTNFFEIFINPPIQSLYLTERDKPVDAEPSDNLVTRLSRDAAISLYPLNGSEKIAPRIEYIEWLLKKLLLDVFETSELFFDLNYRESEVTLLDEALLRREEHSVLRRLVLRVFQASDNRFLLAIDPRTKVYNRLSLAKLLQRFGYSKDYFLTHNDCLVFVEKHGIRRWVRGRIRDFVSGARVKVEVSYLFRGTIEITPERVIPNLSRHDLIAVARQVNSNLDFDAEIKQLSGFTQNEKEVVIRDLFNRYVKPLFPLKKGNTLFSIGDNQLDAGLFPFFNLTQSEPAYLIERGNLPVIRDSRRLSGLSKVEITTAATEHSVVLFGSKYGVRKLKDIVAELNGGITKGPFTFSLPKRFGIRLAIAGEFVNENLGSFDLETDRFLLSNEEKHRDALALVYLPLNSELYYPIKAKLAHHGRVSQVISHEHFDIYAAWNLGTNIFAKLGHIPWSISDSSNFPNADMVLGFAYSSLKHEGRVKRNIGYVNVFDRHGAWKFMQSSSSLLDFDKRLKLIPQLIRNAIIGFRASGESPRIIDIHYSKRFSFVERKRTAEVVRETVPEIQEINFVSIDRTHPLRIFDPNTKSSNVRRGGIFQLNRNEFLLSSSGDEGQDAPAGRLLKLRVWREPSDLEIEILPIAHRVLAMTKLNWRSAVRETSEPVTIKYSEEIAQLTNHFGLTEWTTVNNQLSRIPWFI